MAARTVPEPPASVRAEKDDSITVAFSVADVASASATDVEDPEGPGHVFVSLNCTTPSRIQYERVLRLPHALLPTEIVPDIQTKCVTIRLLKDEPGVIWGRDWIKKEGKKKAKKSKVLVWRPDDLSSTALEVEAEDAFPANVEEAPHAASSAATSVMQDPPVNVSEKGERVTVTMKTINAAKVKPDTFELNYLEDTEGPGVIFASFSSESPLVHYEKVLRLPHPVISARIGSNVQSDCITVKLVKEDYDIIWGNKWCKVKGEEK